MAIVGVYLLYETNMDSIIYFDKDFSYKFTYYFLYLAAGGLLAFVYYDPWQFNDYIDLSFLVVPIMFVFSTWAFYYNYNDYEITGEQYEIVKNIAEKHSNALEYFQSLDNEELTSVEFVKLLELENISNIQIKKDAIEAKKNAKWKKEYERQEKIKKQLKQLKQRS